LEKYLALDETEQQCLDHQGGDIVNVTLFAALPQSPWLLKSVPHLLVLEQDIFPHHQTITV
jgi:hypothetical protein